jgi:MFS family permease
MITIPSEAHRRKLISRCALWGALGWVLTEILYEILFGPHIRLLRALAVGALIGVLVGLITSTMQWLALRRYVRAAGWWIVATTLGYTLAGTISSFLLWQAISNTEVFRTTLPLQGVISSAITGIVVSVAQWFVLADWTDPDLGWRSWIVPITVGTGLAAPAAWLAGAITLLLLTWLLGPGSWALIVVGAYLAAGVVGGNIFGRFIALGFRRTLPEPVAESSPQAVDRATVQTTSIQP